MNELQKTLFKMNDEQKRAVLSDSKRIVCLAGAGSGKTSVLTARTVSLIQNRVLPEQILLLTFTNAAARNMLYKASLIDERAKSVTSGTFHSFAVKILRTYAYVFGLKENFVVIDSSDAEDMVKSCYDGLEMKDGDKTIRPSTVHKIISYSSNTKTSIKEAIISVNSDLLMFEDQIKEIKRRYITKKVEQNTLDFDDLIIYLSRLLENKDAREIIQLNYSHVLVDEHQDSNQIQLDILYGLIGDQTNVMVVGDPAQAIYGFRGSAPDTIFDFKKKYPEAEVISLNKNYRSSNEILNVANRIDEAMTTRFDREMISGTEKEGKVPELISCRDEEHQSYDICNRIVENVNKGHSYQDHAVIVRSMFRARLIEMMFMEKKIPYKVMGGIRIDEASHIKDLISICQMTENKKMESSFLRVFSLFNGVGSKTAKKMHSIVLKNENLINGLQSVSSMVKKDDTFCCLIDSIKEIMNEIVPLNQRILKAIKILEPVFKNKYGSEWEEYRKTECLAVSEMSYRFDTMSDFLTAVTIDYSFDKKKTFEQDKKDDKPVTITTIHSSKGLEWRHVFIPSFIEGHFPSIYSKSQKDIEEEKRILYVAITRAKETLSIYKPSFDRRNSIFNENSSFEHFISDALSKVISDDSLMNNRHKMNRINIEIDRNSFLGNWE